MLGRRRNKRRIYLAFFHREFTPDNPIKYHTAFLVAPKRPNTTSEAKNSRIFHVRKDLSNGREERWIFDPKPTRTRSYLLAGVMLLGKVPNAISADALEAIFESVPRLTAPRDNPRWLCRDWIWSALPILVGENVIKPLPSAPNDVWKAGLAFTEAQKVPMLFNPIPCCDALGRKIASEIGPLVKNPTVKHP
ncbi:hypothetical protein K443DRAFT_3340 [Laccaria amethystina LaAM-08-1]|uniref:Unplaced genomic scaffold K443scaffold_20, whole genome shotgun sequence n=1 Tax=Laccaria amethystina LaAM-08-1 TaxID=1095629 RepID=A0A0C9Y758_9AGAR|nr:hypothetical protein K443DRAFT_3340 [Laccaria amethystina LaAM-08-1]